MEKNMAAAALLAALVSSAAAAPVIVLNPHAVAGNPCNSGGGGLFPDVAIFGGRVWCAVESAGHLQVVELAEDLTPLRIFKRPVKVGLAFPRIGASGGTLYVVYRDGNDGLLWKPIAGGEPEALGPFYGNDPAAIGGPTVAYQGGANFLILRRPLSGGPPSAQGPGRPTGLSRILPSGKVTLVDDERNAVSFGTRPCYADGLVVVEGPNGGTILEQGGRRAIFWPGQDTFTPRCASGGGLFAVATWGKGHTRMFAWRNAIPEGEKKPEAPLTWVEPSEEMGTAHLSGKTRLKGVLRYPSKAAGVDILLNLQKIGEAVITGSTWHYDFDTTPYTGGVNLSAFLREKAGATSRYTLRAELANARGARVPPATAASKAAAAPSESPASVTSAETPAPPLAAGAAPRSRGQARPSAAPPRGGASANGPDNDEAEQAPTAAPDAEPDDD